MKTIVTSASRAVGNLFSRSLDIIELVGNKLPHPATLFALLALLVVIVSWLSAKLGMQATHPVDESIITVRSLLSGDGVRWAYSNITQNFVNFPPLGYVLAVMVGIGLAEGSGLLTIMIRALVLNAPPRLVTGAIVLAGIVSSLATEAGYVVLIPLGAMIFHALGRHPMAGLAAAFCGVSGGFGANFMIGSIDPILAGLSTSAAQILDPEMIVNPAVNFYFMFASAILVTIVGTWVTAKIVEPRLGTYHGGAERLAIDQLTPLERRGLRLAGLSLLVTVALMAVAAIPAGGLLRNPADGQLLNSPFFDGLITGIIAMFFIPGLVFGVVTGSVRSDKDVVKHVTRSMSGMAGYIVLVFFAAQFVYFFR